MLEPYGLITAVVPADGGWHYLQELPDGSTQRIPPKESAGDDRTLVEQVKQFRSNAQIDIGTVEEDIAAYIKRVSPFNNKFPNRRTVVPIATRKIVPLISKCRDWLLQISPKQPRLLIEDDAKDRAAVCAKCPQNIEWRSGCLPCCDEIIMRGKNLRQKVDYPYSDALKACRANGFYLPAAVFVDREALDEAGSDSPDFCWMRTEAKA